MLHAFRDAKILCISQRLDVKLAKTLSPMFRTWKQVGFKKDAEIDGKADC